MKNFYLLSIALFSFNFVNAQNAILSSNELTTDTIQKSISDFQADSLIKVNWANPDLNILDVSTSSEFISGHLINANNIDYFATNFNTQISNLDRNLLYLIYCKAGGRSLPTFNLMVSLHFRELYLMNDGFNQWKFDGFPFVTGIVSNNEKNSAIGKTNIIVYPNPANSKITIELNALLDDNTISIINLNGQELIKKQISITKFEIDINKLPCGIYFVKVKSKNGIEAAKFVKN